MVVVTRAPPRLPLPASAHRTFRTPPVSGMTSPASGFAAMPSGKPGYTAMKGTRERTAGAPYLASRQLSPVPMSTTSGTVNWHTLSISRFTIPDTASSSSGGHSNTSSSCT